MITELLPASAFLGVAAACDCCGRCGQPHNLCQCDMAYGRLLSQKAVPYLSAEPPSARGVDLIEAALGTKPQCEMPLTHRFTPGLYIREIRMPKGALVVSKIHKTEHPFIVSQGHAVVWDDEKGVVHIKAPFTGITKPGTRRVIYIEEDCVWTTFHVTNETDPAKIEADIIFQREPARLKEATA